MFDKAVSMIRGGMARLARASSSTFSRFAASLGRWLLLLAKTLDARNTNISAREESRTMATPISGPIPGTEPERADDTNARVLLEGLLAASVAIWKARRSLSAQGDPARLMSIASTQLQMALDAVQDVGLEIRDFSGEPYEPGFRALKPISFEPSEGCVVDTIIRTLSPAIFWNGRMVVRSEGVVGMPVPEDEPAPLAPTPSDAKPKAGEAPVAEAPRVADPGGASLTQGSLVEPKTSETSAEANATSAGATEAAKTVRSREKPKDGAGEEPTEGPAAKPTDTSSADSQQSAAEKEAAEEMATSRRRPRRASKARTGETLAKQSRKRRSPKNGTAATVEQEPGTGRARRPKRKTTAKKES